MEGTFSEDRRLKGFLGEFIEFEHNQGGKDFPKNSTVP